MAMIERGTSPHLVRLFVLCLSITLGNSGKAWSQSIPPQGPFRQDSLRGRQVTGQGLPNPVRTASGWDDGQQALVETELPLNQFRLSPSPTHQILRAPAQGAAGTSTAQRHKATSNSQSQRFVHPPYSSHVRRLQPPPPTLPGANQRETWKMPYSYGYFGAGGTRRWSLHYGYRESYTQWRLQ